MLDTDGVEGGVGDGVGARRIILLAGVLRGGGRREQEEACEPGGREHFSAAVRRGLGSDEKMELGLRGGFEVGDWPNAAVRGRVAVSLERLALLNLNSRT